MRLALVTVLAVLVGATSVAPASALAQPLPAQPNIVFILTDDLSWDLVRFMPHVRAMQRDGLTFTNYFVTDSLCCPSRASIFTGRYPHNHGVLSNTAPFGGFTAFRRAADSTTFATELQASGYQTAMMGKYLNGYLTRYSKSPGWTNWQVSPGGYRGFNYLLRANGRVAHFGRSKGAYLTDVLRRRGMDFISSASYSGRPFMVEIATTAPHRPATPAPRDRHDFPRLQAPRTASWNRLPHNPPRWLRNRQPIGPAQMSTLDMQFRKRARSVQAVDELVSQVRRQLRRSGLDRNTYIVFSSDNGYHLGTRRLLAGKMTPYDSDVHVPLIVVGPGIKRGSQTDELSANIDLAPTFMRLAGVKPPPLVDGRTLVPLLRGDDPASWRDELLIEHTRPESTNLDPDKQDAPSGNPPSYAALRTSDMLYVEYVTGDREWYDLQSDPDQLYNRFDQLDDSTRELLHERLVALQSCSGAACARIDTP